MTDVRSLARPSAADFLARNGGGGLFTLAVNQRIGSYLCVPAHRLGFAPAVLTITNLVLGVGASVMVAGFASRVPDHDVPMAAVALAALVLWQLAYSFDCADGQLARVTGRASAAGARVDILCDAAVHISLVVAVSISAWAYSPDMPRWLTPAFAGIWIANLLAPSSFERGSRSGSLFADNKAPLVRFASSALDYGVVVTAFALVVAFVPGWIAQLMVCFVAVNLSLLALRVAVAARASVR